MAGLAYQYIFNTPLLAITAAAGTAPTYTEFGIQRSLNPADFGGSPTVYLEVHMKASAGIAYARLYNVTDGAEVASSEVNTSSTTVVRVRSSALALAAGDKVYRVDFGGVAGTGTFTIYDAIVVIESG